MILMRENPLQGLLEGVGPENLDFFGPEMVTSGKVEIFRAYPFKWPE
jgi:hypothetical protein